MPSPVPATSALAQPGALLVHDLVGDGIAVRGPLVIARGALTSVFSPPGDGTASRFVRAVTGQTRVERGVARVGGVQLARYSDALPPPPASIVGRIGADPLPAGASILDIVSHSGSGGLPVPINPRWVEELIRILGLSSSASVHAATLPRALQTRVALARALAAQPCVVIADLPFEWEPNRDRELLESLLLASAAAYDLVLLHATSDPTIAARGHRTIVARAGRIVDVVERPSVPRLNAAAGMVV